MNNKGFISGIITGSMIGLTTGMYAYKMMSPKQRKAVEKKFNKMVDQIEQITDVVNSLQNVDVMKMKQQ